MTNYVCMYVCDNLSAKLNCAWKTVYNIVYIMYVCICAYNATKIKNIKKHWTQKSILTILAFLLRLIWKQKHTDKNRRKKEKKKREKKEKNVLKNGQNQWSSAKTVIFFWKRCCCHCNCIALTHYCCCCCCYCCCSKIIHLMWQIS